MKLEKGTFWRRRKDGKLFEVVWSRNGRVQIKRADAKNLKNTLWLDEERFPALYEPADAPPPPSLPERLHTELGLPTGGNVYVTVGLNFEWATPLSEFAHVAVEFIALTKGTWKWMHVPANGDWYSLSLQGELDGATVTLGGPGGWTRVQANLLTRTLRHAKAADEESRTPAPWAYEGAFS